MIEDPRTPPAALTPMNEYPTNPPTMAVMQVVPLVQQAVQSVVDSLYADIVPAADTVGAVCGYLCEDIRRDLDSVRILYEEFADRICAQILSRVAYAASMVDDLVDIHIPYVQIQQMASQMPLPLSQIVGLPNPPGYFTGGSTPSVPLIPSQGGLIGVPVWPAPPAWVTSTIPGTVPVPSQGQSTVPWGTAPGGDTRPGGAVPTMPTTTTPGRPTRPYTGSPGRPTRPGRGDTGVVPTGATGGAGGTGGSGGQSTTGGSGGTIRPTVGEGVNNLTPPAIAPGSTQTPSNENGGVGSQVGQEGGGAAGNATPGARDCPPVTVIVQCAPGSQASAVPAPGVTVQQGASVGDVFVSAEASAQGGQGGDGATVEVGPQLAEGGYFPPLGENEKYRSPYRGIGPQMPQQPEQLPQPQGAVIEDLDRYYALEAVKNATWKGVFTQVTTADGCMDWADLNRGLDVMGKDLWRVVFGDQGSGSFGLKSALDRVIDTQTPLGKWILQLFTNVATEGATWLQTLTQVVGGCDSPSFPALQGLKSLLGFVERWIGASFDEAQTKVNYLIGQQCAVELPNQEEIDNAYLLGTIDKLRWECWTKSLGTDVGPKWMALRAKMPRPGPMEMLRIGRQRGLPEGEAQALMKGAGVHEEFLQNYFVELSKYVPGPGDLIRFMVRDVFDEAIVERYGYDEEFDQKWQGQALEWGRQQGMTEEQALYYWRAHWQLPSPTQAYEFLHRLRPGRVGADIETVPEDVEKLLEIADIPEFWRKRLMAVSYHPLTRVDTRRAYFLGSLSYDDTKQAILDLGYAEREAKHLLDFWTFERVNWLASQPIGRAYVRGSISDTEYEQWIAQLNLTPNVQDKLEQTLELRADEVLRRDTIKALKSSVVRGLVSDDDARNRLLGMGFRRARAHKMVQSWEDTRAARGKEVAAAQLCKMHDRGLIDTEDYADALSRQGYSPGDVKNIMALCIADNESAKLKKGISEEQKAHAEETRELNRSRRERQRKAAERARVARAVSQRSRDEERVQKRLTEAMGRLSKAMGGLPSEYREAVTRWFNVLHTEKGFTRQGAAEFAKEIAAQVALIGGDDYSRMGTDLARGVPGIDTLTGDGREPELLPPVEPEGEAR